MGKGKKIFLGIIIAIAIIIIGIIATYYISFSPKTATTSIDTPIEINQLNLAKKFIPKDIGLSFTGITATSNTVFSSQELTELAILAVQQIPEAKEYVTGLKVTIENDDVVIYAPIKYHGIPLEARFIFKPYAKDGKGIFHYESGNIGFIQIPKDVIFEKMSDNSIVQFNKTNGDIILHFNEIKQITVTDLYAKNSNIAIKFEGKINFFK